MKSALATLLVLSLAACSPAPPSGTPTTPAADASTAMAASASTPATDTDADSGDTTTRLGAYHWRLVRASDQSGVRIDALLASTDKPLQLDFAANRLSISNTCNRMQGSFSVTDGRLTIGQLASTMMACQDPALTALDAAVGKYLGGALRLAITPDDDKPELLLTTTQGDTLEFGGVPTAETRYGSTGETGFLEVAAQTKTCTHATTANAKCLEVRELNYGANGLREGEPGPWHVLDQGIEGYAHEAGVRNVLRVKRYRLADAPAGSSSVAYVLDMVVESQRPTQ